MTTAWYYPQLRPISCHGQRGQPLFCHFLFSVSLERDTGQPKLHEIWWREKFKKNNLLKVTENLVCLTTKWKVGRYWRDGKRASQEKPDFLLARAASKKFFSVDLLVCARSHLSARSVNVGLLDFKSAESLAIPIGAGGDTPGWEVLQAGRLHPLALKMLFGYPW